VVGPGAGALQAPDTIRDLISSGYRVEVILEQEAGRFIGPAAVAGLAPSPALHAVWAQGTQKSPTSPARDRP
jgi:phosphopantothenoylcysteine synthetase/decarboxylase